MAMKRAYPDVDEHRREQAERKRKLRERTDQAEGEPVSDERKEQGDDDL